MYGFMYVCMYAVARAHVWVCALARSSCRLAILPSGECLVGGLFHRLVAIAGEGLDLTSHRTSYQFTAELFAGPVDNSAHFPQLIRPNLKPSRAAPPIVFAKCAHLWLPPSIGCRSGPDRPAARAHCHCHHTAVCAPVGIDWVINL